MVQHVIGFGKRPAAAGTNRVDVSTRVPAEATVALRAIPLKLAPILSPYKRNGRVMIRIERLHHLARLSAGRNNGNNSWSLTPDETEDIAYLLPEGMNEPHTLAIRIIDMEGGSTITVLDYLVSPAATGPATEHEGTAARSNTVGLRGDTQLRHLSDELANVKATFTDRESELTKTRQRPEQAGVEFSRQKTEADLTKTQAIWKKELDWGLTAAAAQAASDLKQHRAAWETEQNARLIKSEERTQERLAEEHKRWQQEAQDVLMQAEQTWKTGEDARLAVAKAQWWEQSGKALAEASTQARAALERWRQESQEALSRAEQAWKADTATRLAAAESQWQEQSAKSLAEARAQSEATRAQSDADELSLREKLTALETRLVDRDAASARIELENKQERERWQRETQEALLKAEQAWKVDEDARFAAAEAQWQEKSATALAEARVQSEAEHERRQRETQEALSKAEQAWKVGEDARFAAAEAQWQEKSATALAEARSEAERVRAQGDESEPRRPHEKLTALQTMLADRENTLARVEMEAKQARESQQRETQEALRKAEQVWKDGEDSRFDAAEAQWQERSTSALAEATARREQAEAALTQRDAEAAAARDQGEEELRRLRDECASMKETLAGREAELVQMRLTAEQEREDGRRESKAALEKAEKTRKADEAARFTAAEKQWRKQSARALAKATSRFQTAEAALAQVRAEAASHRSALADRETELAYARAEIEQSHSLHPLDAQTVYWPKLAEDNPKPPRSSRRLIRDVVLAASLAAAAIMFYPTIVSHIPEPWRAKINAITSEIGIGLSDLRVPAASPSPVLPPADGQYTAVVLNDVNVRDGPSTASNVISTLWRGLQVVTIEQRGNWTFVQFDGENGEAEPRQGWVYSPYLIEAGGGDANTAPAEPG